MAFTTGAFGLFVAAGLLLYSLIPKKARPYLLLALSYAFYLSYGVSFLPYLLFTTLSTYSFARLLNKEIPKADGEAEKEYKKRAAKQKKFLCAACLLLNFSLLYFVKYWNFTLDELSVPKGLLRVDLVLPLGISFYIFQSMGYLIDVKRGKYPAEKNIFRFALFVSFFPQLVQGPIARYDELAPQLYRGDDFSFDNLKSGVKTAFWGLLKKLVIADRAAVCAGALLDAEKGSFGGGMLLCGILFYCLQLYCDFSGGIDIARGVGKLFGIDMAQNFRRPIFSESLAEFWRRWHITLGAWLKDYLFYPLTLSKPFIRFGKFTRRHIKGSAGKILSTSLATFIVYFVIGIWHGANFKYILFGVYNGVIITSSLLLEPRLAPQRLREVSYPPVKARTVRVLRVLRTSVLVVIGRYITRAADIPDALYKFGALFTDFRPRELCGETFLALGLSGIDYLVLLLGALLLFAVEFAAEKERPIDAAIEKKGTAAVFIASLLLFAAFLAFGVFRGSYIASEFIYKQF